MTSEPVLLVVNADTCHYCEVLIKNKASITQAVKSKFPKINNVWVSLDKMSFSIFPFEWMIPNRHFPILFYFPTGAWESYISGESFRMVHIMDGSTGFEYNLEGIISWLDKVVQPQDRTVIADNWSRPQSSFDHSNEFKDLVRAVVREVVEEKYSEQQRHKLIQPVSDELKDFVAAVVREFVEGKYSEQQRHKLNQPVPKKRPNPVDSYEIPIQGSRSVDHHEIPTPTSRPVHEQEKEHHTQKVSPDQPRKDGNKGITTDYWFDFSTNGVKLRVGTDDVNATISVNAYTLIDSIGNILRLSR